MSLDFKDFFLASPEFVKIHKHYITHNIMEKYNLHEKIDNDYIYVRTKKGMCGLKQAAILAYNHLVKNLEPHGYFPIPHTTGLWRHKCRKTTFCLCVDDFGVKYFNQDDANHLIQALQSNYKISTDWSGKHCCGLTFDWDYDQKGFVDVSMPKYVPKLLQRYQHPTPKRPQFTPFLIIK